MSSSCVGLRNEPIYLHDMKHFRGVLGGIALLNKILYAVVWLSVTQGTDEISAFSWWELESYPFKVYFDVT